MHNSVTGEYEQTRKMLKTVLSEREINGTVDRSSGFPFCFNILSPKEPTTTDKMRLVIISTPLT